jgi:hypothetical protein
VEGEEEFKVTGNINVITTQLHSYLAGYMGKQYLKRIVCKTCRNHILTNIREEGGLVEARAYSAKALLNANSKFRRIFSRSCEVLLFFAKNVYCNRLKKKLKQKLFKFVLNDVEWKCDNHNLVEEFGEKFVKFYIFTWVNNVNRVLSGRDHRNLNDLIKQKAQVKYYKT